MGCGGRIPLEPTRSSVMINVTGRGNWIEGTDGSDNLVGTNDSENIHGNGGGDVIEGLGGADVLYGDDNTNTHNDTVSYAHSPAGVLIDLTQFPQHGGDAEGDLLYNFDHVIGSAFSDTITGNDN